MYYSNHDKTKTPVRLRPGKWTIYLLCCAVITIQLLTFNHSRAQEESDGMGEACFNHFDLTGGGKGMNSYLMLTTSYFVYPAEVGVEELSAETEAFQGPFEERLRHFGMDQFLYIHEESPFEMEDFLGAYDEIHHTDCVVMANDAAIIVVCRGSLPANSDPTNWITNLSFLSENVSHHFESDIPEDSEVWCHTGFWTAADSVYTRVRDCISFLKVQNNRPVYLTGHSLGGALATILSMRLYTDGIVAEEIYTYAAPRVGDSGFAGLFASSGVVHHRWMNRGDPGPVLPPEVFGYRHTGFGYVTDRLFADPMTAHSCLQYAKGVWDHLSVEERDIVPRWFESDWVWVTPEGSSAPDNSETGSSNLSDPRDVDFTHNEYDPYYYLDTDNKDLFEKQKQEEGDSLKYTTVMSPEELEREVDKWLYLYEEEKPTASRLDSQSGLKREPTK